VSVYEVKTLPPPSKTEAATAAAAAGSSTPIDGNPPDPFVTRHYFNLDCYHWNPQSLQTNIRMETFKPALTPSPTVQRIIRHFIRRFNNNKTLPRTCWQSVWDIILKNWEIHCWEIRKQNTFYFADNEINYVLVHLHILPFII
jgi:hypothetical protein